MLALTIIATIFLSLNIFCTLISMIVREEINTVFFVDIFALIIIWILYLN